MVVYLNIFNFMNRKYKKNRKLGDILNQMKKSVGDIYDDKETLNRLIKCGESVESSGCVII